MMKLDAKNQRNFERVNGLFHPLPLLVAFLSIFLAGCESGQPSDKEDAFPLSELNPDRNLMRENINLAGKKLVVNFWATWCRPCREEMPYLQELSDSLDPAQFAIVGVSIDEDSNLVKEFLLDYNIQYPNYLDLDRQLAEQHLGITAYPETLLVSKQGVIQHRILGAITPENDHLQKFLGLQDRARLIFPGSSSRILPL